MALLAVAGPSIWAQWSHPALAVQTVNGQTTFHIGERIPLKFTFTSPNDTEFMIVPYPSDHGGEFDMDKFEVSPSTGWADPLATYLAQDRMITGHGWPPQLFLKSKPVELTSDLNQWVRFDQPGVYQLHIISLRVSYAGKTAYTPYTLQSNTIELHIIPATPEWQAETMQSILATLNKPEYYRDPAYPAAIANLRYLATSAAIDKLTSGLRSSDSYGNMSDDCYMGIVGLPDSMRNTAIESMNRRIEQPDFPISGTFFNAMFLLHVAPGSSKESIREQRRAYEPVLWQAIYSVLPKKDLEARAATVQTLINGHDLRALGLQSEMAALLKDSFLNLSSQSQVDDLQLRWDMLRSPEMLPALRKIASEPPQDPANVFPSQNLKSAALHRWYELDPVAARREILVQIGSATPSLSAQALWFFPAEPLPEFEPLWANAFLNTTDQEQQNLLGSLLVKFGTGAATSQMVTALGRYDKEGYCTPYIVALAYLVRFRPDTARTFLTRRDMAGKAIECNDGNFLGLVGQYAAGAALNEGAVEALDSANPSVVRDAANYLTLYGTKKDFQPLWDRYVRWTQTWSGKAAVLDPHRINMVPLPTDDSLSEGISLGNAIISNQGWLADPSLIARVLRRCVGETMCQELKDTLQNAGPPYEVSLPDTSGFFGMTSMQPSYGVAQYTSRSLDLFKAKIRQYPPGTRFTLGSSAFSTADQRKLEDEMIALFKNEGMSLAKSTN